MSNVSGLASSEVHRIPHIDSMEDLLRAEIFPVEILQKHNAFPDALFFHGREYLIFRSAPHHNLHKKSVLILSSREGDGAWKIETTIQGVGYDVRDPRLVVFEGTIHIYFAAVNKGLRRPVIAIMHSVLQPDNTWSTPMQVYASGYLPSRVHVVGGKLYMTVYEEWTLKRSSHLQCQIIVSDDGTKWSRDTEFGVLCVEGMESDCVSIDPDILLWIVRNDIGTKMPVGSNIYMIRRDGQVENVHNTRVKYDSPLLIRRGDAIYLLSRLQLSFAGRYRIASSRLPRIFRDAVNIGLYFCTPKTTALSQIDRASFEMKKLVSITSCGDTGYCSFAEDGNRSFIYTYSSNMGKPNKSWIEGQMQKTSIYRFTAQW